MKSYYVLMERYGKRRVVQWYNTHRVDKGCCIFHGGVPLLFQTHTAAEMYAAMRHISLIQYRIAEVKIKEVK